MNEMDTDVTGEAEIREEVRDWLKVHWEPETDRRNFLELVVESGWACPTWDANYFGKGLSESLALVVQEEFDKVGAPSSNLVGVNQIAAEVIKNHATSEEMRRYVQHKLLTGEFRTCLLYSEPGAGSDLAGLQTRADRDGEEWLVNGQKVWVSAARQATHGLLPARTNWDAPKHRGITFFLLPMNQAGIEIYPIKQMTGDAIFNEVLLTDVRVSDQHRISDVNDGWRVLNNALAIERMMLGGAIERPRVEAGEFRPEDPKKTADLVSVAKQLGRNIDPVIRQDIARVHALRRIVGWNAERAHGMTDMNTATVLKLSMSQVLHGSARVYAQMLGTEAMLAGAGSAQGHEANRYGMRAFVTSIGAGSDQIQRNLIAERVLGLPRDPSVDYDVPFKDVRKSDASRRFSEGSG